MSDHGTREQPAPTGTGAEVWPLVLRDVAALADRTNAPDDVSEEECDGFRLLLVDMRARDAMGRERYGTPLRVGNGRDALLDAYHEALDCCVYLRQEEVDEEEPAPHASDVRAAYMDALHLARRLRHLLLQRDGR